MAWVASAQDYSSPNQTSPNIVISQNPSQKDVLPCKAGTNFETDEYRIARVTVDDPFRFLYLIGAKIRDIEAQLRTKLNNQLFTYQLVNARALGLIESARFAPE